MYGFDYDQVENMEREMAFSEGLAIAQAKRQRQFELDDEDNYEPEEV